MKAGIGSAYIKFTSLPLCSFCIPLIMIIKGYFNLRDPLSYEESMRTVLSLGDFQTNEEGWNLYMCLFFKYLFAQKPSPQTWDTLFFTSSYI